MVVPNYIIDGKTLNYAFKHVLPIKMYYKILDGKIGFADEDEAARNLVSEFIKNEYDMDVPAPKTPADRKKQDYEFHLKFECLATIENINITHIIPSTSEERRQQFEQTMLNNLDTIIDADAIRESKFSGV
jgi:hypothetical protein